MKTVADLKRLKVGQKAKLIFSHYPGHKYLNVEREVSAVQTNGLWFRPLGTDRCSSFLSFPKKAEFEGTDNGWKILENGTVLLEYQVI